MAPTATFLDLVKGRLSESQERLKELRRQISEAETTEAAYQAVYSQELRRAQYEGDRIVVPPPPVVAVAAKPAVVTVPAPSTNGHHAEREGTDRQMSLNEVQTAILLVLDQHKDPVPFRALRNAVQELVRTAPSMQVAANLSALGRGKVIENLNPIPGEGLFRRVAK